jgi:hypothetical protein
MQTHGETTDENRPKEEESASTTRLDAIRDRYDPRQEFFASDEKVDPSLFG